MDPDPWAAVVVAARADPEAIAVLLHGSMARGDPTPRDIDVAVVLAPDARTEPAEAHLRYVEHSSGVRHSGLDVCVFQAVPLYVRQRILAAHKVLWVRDEAALDALYDVA